MSELIFFFFSSRRRHTRSLRDWSSDVCSSDLAGTFALGAGLAGLAGCAITQIGNVGPELGQNYIVDSFMVVVTGGVGKLLGTILAAVGIGGLNKIIEPGLGAVFGKVGILVLVILFIQRRPSGLFAAKGRYADS